MSNMVMKIINAVSSLQSLGGGPCSHIYDILVASFDPYELPSISCIQTCVGCALPPQETGPWQLRLMHPS